MREYGYEFRDMSEEEASGKPGESAQNDPDEAIHDGSQKILCRECGHVITRLSERTEAAGGHEHTFANPAGILFQIGCFKHAEGCGYVGSATAEWSWFPGYLWRVAVCAKCFTHIGWYYLGEGRQSFHGLIFSRLVQEQ